MSIELNSGQICDNISRKQNASKTSKHEKMEADLIDKYLYL